MPSTVAPDLAMFTETPSTTLALLHPRQQSVLRYHWNLIAN